MRRGRKPKRYDSALAEAWFRAVVPPRATCLVCDTRRSLQGHHALPKQQIEQFCSAARLEDGHRNRLLWDERNGISLCVADHERHTKAFRRVPRGKLPGRVWEFAADLDFLADLLAVRGFGSGWATEKLKAEYPE